MDNKLRLAFAAGTLQFWLAYALQHPTAICSTSLTYVQLQPVHILVEKPIQLSASITSNTTIAVDDTLTVTVTNAPLILITELTQYETITTILKSLCDERGECWQDPDITNLGLSYSTINALVSSSKQEGFALDISTPITSETKDSHVPQSSTEMANLVVSSNLAQITAILSPAVESGPAAEQHGQWQTSQEDLDAHSNTANDNNSATMVNVAGLGQATISIPTIPFSQDRTDASHSKGQASVTTSSPTDGHFDLRNTTAAVEGSSIYLNPGGSSNSSPTKRYEPTAYPAVFIIPNLTGFNEFIFHTRYVAISQLFQNCDITTRHN
ncbi:hypothetical protein BHE90_006305 [Fusarium euwallaceae]|uniref:Uncharacterized protein n=1 Tax=Fusarium euwallaceae TaxID=1147111 RepID=A0A430LU02_9HYPO|nr:hypothetical protein BHE90_006305 [Fusarium euwallaceae]